MLIEEITFLITYLLGPVAFFFLSRGPYNRRKARLPCWND